MIAIVNYRAGNLTSVKKALDHLGVASEITSDAEVVAYANKIILPGVGHFSMTSVLDSLGLRRVILDRVNRGVPFLGICVGMQWLFQSSNEAPSVPGSGLLIGNCERFSSKVKSPHVGWNSLTPIGASLLLRGVPSGSFVYFTHSYRAPVLACTVASSEYGGQFSAAVERENVFGVQFHPEKSGDVGLALLQNFCRL
jgi:glutamine amidotransferase